jgi:alkylation response protein AidB-like acyl-CoA dehydrogenase
MIAPPTYATIRRNVDELAAQWLPQRAERQARRHLEEADFEALAATGFLYCAVPVDQGGCWESVAQSTAGVCDALRALAGADASVALVAAMHPAVLSYWLATEEASDSAWTEQRVAAFASAAAGKQWGTITSEPGSGGDVMRTKTRAERDGAATGEVPGQQYLLTGDKHFGSGYGISHYMFTTALPDGEETPAAFFMDMHAARNTATPAITVTAPWDGAGMTATQSHAARLERMPATRLAWSGDLDVLTFNAVPLISMVFTAVVLGVFDAAIEYARGQLGPKREGLRAFEQVEWTRADLDHWAAVQAFDGALRTVQSQDAAAGLHAGLRAKTVVAEAAERGLRRIAQVLGGGTFARRSPVSAWFEDVRALGFLRPPWGLAYDGLFGTSFGD